MYVSELAISNVRGFSGSRAVDLKFAKRAGSRAGFTVLAGRNGSGKTTLLRGLALGLAGPAVARSLVPGFDDWIAQGEDAATVSVTVERSPDSDTFTGSGRAPAGTFDCGLRWDLASPATTRRDGTVAQPSLSETSPRSTPRRGPWADNPSGWFCAGYGPFRRLTGGSGDAQRLMMSPPPVARFVSLFHEDASLAEGVSWLIALHLRRLERKDYAADVLDVVLSLLGDGLLPDSYELEDVTSDGVWVRRGDQSFALRELSDGYRTVTALVLDITRQIYLSYGELPTQEIDGAQLALAARGVVLIDEIDAHLHVTWQKKIGDWLTRHFPNIQFIVTTHSPYICQSADRGGLIRLPGPDENRSPEVVGDELYERVVFGTGDDAVLSDLFGLESPYSVHAEELRRELNVLELRVLRGEADRPDTDRYRSLKDSLSGSPSARVDQVAARLRPR